MSTDINLLSTPSPCQLSYRIREIATSVSSDKIHDINNLAQVVNSLNLKNLTISYEEVFLPITIPNPCNPNETIETTTELLKIRLLGMVYYSVLVYEVTTSALTGYATTDFIDLIYGYMPPPVPAEKLDPTKFHATLTLDPLKVDTTTSTDNTIFLLNGVMSLSYDN